MRRWLAGVLFVFSIVLLTISIYFLMGMFRDYRAEDEMHGRLKEIHERADVPEEDTDNTSASVDTESQEPEVVIDEGLLELHAENPDCIYWITIPDTPIDYPVMYHPQEKDYYLHRDFYGSITNFM